MAALAMDSTSDLFMEVIEELRDEFGEEPTAEQLMGAMGVTLEEAQQVLCDLERVPAKPEKVPAKSAAAKKAAAKKAAAKSVPAPTVAVPPVTPAEEETQEEPQAVRAAHPEDLEAEEDDATVRHPSPQPFCPDEGEESEEPDDDVQVVQETITPRQETPLGGVKRHLRFVESSSQKRQASMIAVCFFCPIS